MLRKILLKYVINDLSSLQFKVYDDVTLSILHLLSTSVCPDSLSLVWNVLILSLSHQNCGHVIE